MTQKAREAKTEGTTNSLDETGLWDRAARAKLSEWDPAWASLYCKMTDNPWTSGVLPRRFVELAGIAINAACTNLNPEGTRRHMRAALEAGATREEILLVLKCASAMAIHSCSLGAPMLLEEAKVAGIQVPPPKEKPQTPACNAMRAAGQWNAAWDPFLDLDPGWTDAFMASSIGIYKTGVLPAKEIELLSIAFDASFTHMYAPGTRRHIKNALKAGATVDEIMEVLKLCVVQGAQACNLGVPLLAKELANHSSRATGSDKP